jgi:hypothetical protein
MPLLSRRKVLWTLGILMAVIATLFGVAYGWYRYTYPYGWTHCCLKGIGIALEMYAQKYDGHYPAGGGCPEASLSLLYKWGKEDHTFAIDGYYLCGKTKSAEAAQKILEGGGLLGPDTCDWHYVEGLTTSDDNRLALVWDKVGLGHNGGRLWGGGHSIWRLHGGEEIIPGSEWPKFLEEQKWLMASEGTRPLPALTAKIRLPSGPIVDHYDAPYSLEEDHSGVLSRGPATSSGEKCRPLRWDRFWEDGTYTFILSLNGWKSKPVEVKVSQGKATPNPIIFEMQVEKSESKENKDGCRNREAGGRLLAR